MKSEFGILALFFLNYNFSVSLSFYTFSFHRSISVGPLYFFFFLPVLLFFSFCLSTLEPHILLFSAIFLSILISSLLILSVCSPYILVSLSSPWSLCFFLAVCTCLSICFTKFGLHPIFYFLSLSLICLSFRSTTFALLALVQQCNKDVRKFMTPLIPSKVFRLCYVMIRCFLLWKRR